MKRWLQFVLVAALVLPTVTFADEGDDIDWEITEGKIQAAELNMIDELCVEVDKKLQNSSEILSRLGQTLDPIVFSSYLGRWQFIKQTRKSVDRTNIDSDLKKMLVLKDLMNKLISDLNSYVK
jgi:hypothetical protein